MLAIALALRCLDGLYLSFSLFLSSPSHLVLYVLSAHRPIKACLGIEGERVEGREEMGGGEWGEV